MSQEIIQEVLGRVRRLREEAGLSADELEADLLLGPGWVEAFESGRVVPTLDVLLTILGRLGVKPGDVFGDLEASDADLEPSSFTRALRAEQDGADLVVRFPYAKFDASHRLEGATLDDFDAVIKALRDGLARLVDTPVNGDEDETTAIKSDAVATMFLTAMEFWPHANPSDVWWFIVYRAFCDPFNHPAKFARLNLDQSWK